MYQLNRWKKTPGILQLISGSLLIALPTAPLVASAAPVPRLNSCPGIYYEEPFNTNVRVPQGCRSNAANQRLNQQGLGQNIVPPARPTNVTQPPLPETRQTPIATVMPIAGEVSVKLTNSTNAPISYQAIGHTESRMLARGAEIVLQNLPTPVTVTMLRVDGGLLKVKPMSSSEKGMLAVSIDETSNFDGNQGVLRIQPDGQVFLN
ncbi:hypothetical protein [Tychonema sp. LEGE 07203]|uniref:hypothetical protein n=1 Tax=Tychonema sp. LEGE 07203 TaxID=1828671 RepID=UPI00188266E1|nr:hypothetical protein [Tychonema sp. LEGE 07203]MBE9093317.1 hypothetical protein [Tychonema sp. LEGE 07203]